MSQVCLQKSAQILEELVSAAGKDCVIVDDRQLELYGQDLHSVGERPIAVIIPVNQDVVSQVAAICLRHNVPLAPRGGGLSYSSGYLAPAPFVQIDLSKLDQIVEVSPTDMYVTVEPGVTWETLDAALEPYGLRTPFWGPLSGKMSTIGGAVSQNAVWWGSGTHGFAADSVLCLDVVLADGSKVSTGSAAGENALPFLRQFGPDLTGLFLADTGSLAIKTQITLRLIKRPTAFRFASFNFADGADAMRSMSAVGREQIAAENFMFDPFLSAIRIGKSDDLVTDIKRMGRVVKSQGLLSAMKIALQGRRFAKGIGYSQHVIIEAQSEEEASAGLRRAKKLATEHGGKEFATSIPKVALAEPFPFPRSVLGPKGERWLGRHVLLPHSRTVEMLNLWNAELAEHQKEIEQARIQVAALCCTVGSNVVLFEMHLFWPDASNPIHDHILGEKVTSKLTNFEANPSAREVIDRLSERFAEIGASLGATHMQIGRAYPFKATRKPSSWELLEQLKSAVDPTHNLNPGSLGFEQGVRNAKPGSS